MYTVTSQVSIEFYYKEDTILAIAERDSAYKAKRTVNKDGTKDLVDISNYSKDEKDFGYDAIKMAFTDLFMMLQKVADPSDAYFHVTGGPHGAFYYSGIFVIDYETYNTTALEMIDNLFTMGAAYKVLADWYLLTPLEGMAKYYAGMYENVRKDLLKLTFNLRKPNGGNIISISPTIKSKTVTQTIPAGVLTTVSHYLYKDNYSVDIYDSNGKEIGEGIIQTRNNYSIQVYSAIVLTNTRFYFIGGG